MKKSRLVICPHCDKEQRVGIDVAVTKCRRCRKGFNIDVGDSAHPQEFWHNPDTSPAF